MTVMTNGRSMAGSRTTAGAAVEPLVEMNTTPLIDVMLVLLIMLIITIPPQSHDVNVDLPTGVPLPTELRLLKNELTVTAAGAALWNGTALSDAELRRMLTANAALDPTPELHFRPDPAARYERVDQVLAMVDRAGVTRFGFVGNERYGQSF